MLRRSRRSAGLLALALLPVITAGSLLAQQPEPDASRSPGAARTLSAFGTIAPIGVALVQPGAAPAVLVGLVLGPATGYLYAGEAGRGMRRVAGRAAVMGGAIAGAVLICSAGDCSLGLFGGDDGDQLGSAVLSLAAGLVGTSVLAVSDIIRVGQVVEARNQRLGAVSVRPHYSAEARSAGVLLRWGS